MVEILSGNPLLYLFIVAALGYPLGKIKVMGCGLGVAAVLFVGLAFGSIDPALKLPEIIYVLGLVLFVYTVGLSSGPEFTASLKREGIRNNFFAAGILAFACLLIFVLSRLIGVDSAMAAGMFAGSLTNTPALAGALETLKGYATGPEAGKLLSEPVVAYSITYPMGVIGVLMAMTFARRLWKVDFAKEARGMRAFGALNEPLFTRDIRVTNPEVENVMIRELFRRFKWNAVFGRIKREEHFLVAVGGLTLKTGDLVVVVGPEDEIRRIMEYLGEPTGNHIELDRSEVEVRRIFVSNPDVAGRSLAELSVDVNLGAVVSRVRRGDVDVLVHGETALEMGDRVRVVARREDMKKISGFFGDSYKGVSEVDVLTFSLGLAMGLVLGIIPIPLPGGTEVKLGFAGGPLIAGLVLGTIRHSGSLVWAVPYSANMTLRQIGIVMFLAGVGTRAGYGFASTLFSAGGLAVFFAGAAVTFAAAFAALAVGYKLLGIPMNLLFGMVAGMHTQPAVLGFALEQTKNEIPNAGYSAVYPAATLIKIALAQMILSIHLAI
ncbi:MAG: transporter [Nitrospinae bacterium]|nr:transporter [Nitrospinota bacterium]